MTDTIVTSLLDPSVLIALLVGLAVLATLVTVLPAFGEDRLQTRMKAVALEREELRARQRVRLAAADGERRRRGLRETQSTGMRTIVERFDLRRLLADEATMAKLRAAGFRGQNPLTRLLFLRLVLPIVGLVLGLALVFGLNLFSSHGLVIRLAICILFGYAGFYAPLLYVSNRAAKRQASIERAWPDALDLMLICVESGMSIEVAMRRVADEVGSQSVPLAAELMLTNAELSFLEHRRQAFENLALRTGLDTVRSLTQALAQAERYGTPIAQALRVLADESRDKRMNAAEQKAAALPPKLTVPMILFFLPVLFVIILGPAGMQLARQGLF